MAYYYWEREIPKWSCEKIIEEFDVSSSEVASTGNYLGVESLSPEEIENYKKHDNWDSEKNEPKNLHKPNHSVRRTTLNWLPKDHKYNSILLDYVVKANENVYHYDISKFTPCQFAQYNVGDFYDYHQDSGHQYVEYEKETRKLSMTVQLSDSKDYEGGEFQFYNGNEDPDIPPIPEQGSILIFDSRMYHRVTPITKGVRYSLVSWVLGPHFR